MDAGTFIISLVVSASAGGAIISVVMKHYSDQRATARGRLVKLQAAYICELSAKLTNLRRNAFLTNEHGHRVRYHKASAEVRARAEAGE